MPNRVLVLRVDANAAISAGHSKRCLAIAREWRRRGGRCLFVCADQGTVPFVDAEGFEHAVLGTDWKNLDEEIPLMSGVLATYNQPLLLIDTYQVTPTYVKALAPLAVAGYLGTKRIPTDDLRFLINYSVAADKADYKHANAGCMLLMGPSYAPLREEFHVRSESSRDGKFKSILLTTGNTDAPGMVPALIEELAPRLASAGILLKVVVGPMFVRRDLLLEKWFRHPVVELLDGVSDMAALMRSCDLAISACGTTLYELAACGVPTVGFSLVPEQDAGGETEVLNRLGVIEYAGRAYEDRRMCVAAVCNAVARLMDDAPRRALLAHMFHALVDGRGCARICDELERLEGDYAR